MSDRRQGRGVSLWRTLAHPSNAPPPSLSLVSLLQTALQTTLALSTTDPTALSLARQIVALRSSILSARTRCSESTTTRSVRTVATIDASAVAALIRNTITTTVHRIVSFKLRATSASSPSTGPKYQNQAYSVNALPIGTSPSPSVSNNHRRTCQGRRISRKVGRTCSTELPPRMAPVIIPVHVYIVSNFHPQAGRWRNGAPGDSCHGGREDIGWERGTTRNTDRVSK